MTENRIVPVSFIIKDALLPWRDMLLSSGAELMDYPAGTHFSVSGKPTEYVYFLLRGIVKTSAVGQDGTLRLLGYHKANTIITLDTLRAGRAAALSNEALTTVTALRFTPALLQKICKQHPDFGVELSLYISDVLCQLCSEGGKQGADDVRARLLVFLRLYIESCAELGTEANVIPMTQEMLASAICASRIQTSRICTQLKAQGIIRIGRRRIEVLDAVGLSAAAK